MKKFRLIAILLALVLCAATLLSCSDEQPEGGPNAPAGSPPSGDNYTPGDNDNDMSGNTDPESDPDADPGVFLAENGYPMAFVVRFERDGYGFDTATNTLLNGSDSVTYTFTADDYRDLYNYFDNVNFWTLPLNLTYSNLTGNSAPEGAGIQYTLTVSRADRDTRTCYVDSAAISRLADDPDVANMGSLVRYLDACIAMYHENAAS